MFDRLKRSPLALRIYLVGVAQIAVVLFGFVTLSELNRPPPPHELHAEERALAEAVEAELADAASVERTLMAAREPSGLEATVVDPNGSVVASTVPDDAPQCVRHPRPLLGSAPFLPGHARPPPPEHSPRPPRGARPSPPDGKAACYTMALAFPSGETGHIEFRRTRPAPLSPFNPILIGFVLLVVTVTSLLLARSLARPLAKLATAARDFGEGDLSARTEIDRTDELGEVARAFDDMAARVADLVHAEKELVANVSHELRTPLARIRVALDIASEGDASAIQESLVDITDDLAELERLVSDIVTAARLDLAADAPRGIPPLRKEKVSLNDLLAQAAKRFRRAYPDRPLEMNNDDELPPLEGDPVLLHRVIDNLLDNAHKYSDAPTHPVQLTTTRDGDEVLIEVRDHGVGIAARDLSGVFHPFFRVDRSRTRATGGLGLGLALVKRIVDAHGGSISLESVVDEGTVVSVRLPSAPSEGLP